MDNVGCFREIYKQQNHLGVLWMSHDGKQYEEDY